MQLGNLVEFRTLLSEEEYNRLMERFKGNRMDLQTNHYFDTKRFSLKAMYLVVIIPPAVSSS